MIVRWARMTLGFILLGVGILGWILPVIPGWALFIPGLILLAKEFHWARRLLEYLKRFYPQKLREKHLKEKQPQEE